jgi:Leucine-rich repeat (LRR) protein
MKKYIFAFLAAFLTIIACSDDSGQDPTDDSPTPEERTPIPDGNFEEALVALGLDDQVDGSVLTSRIEGIQRLDVSESGISDLSGIEDFMALTDLNVRDNELTLLDIRSNTNLLFVWAENNQLAALRIGTNPGIEKIGASGNNLTTLDVADYTSLQLLDLADNDLTAMDVSTLPVPSFREFAIEGNPLTCILVSPQQQENIPDLWTKDEEDTYSLDCE